MEVDQIVCDSVEKLYEIFGHPSFFDEKTKIENKLEEAQYNPGSVRVWSDCILAVLLAARGQGYSPKAVFKDLAQLAADTREKTWKKMPDGTYQAM